LNHTNGPIIVEIICNIQARFPRTANKPLPNGTFKNMPHEEMEPFLDDEFINTNLFVKRI
jgi:acetolactate synthase I/II/III large subunit